MAVRVLIAFVVFYVMAFAMTSTADYVPCNGRWHFCD